MSSGGVSEFDFKGMELKRPPGGGESECSGSLFAFDGTSAPNKHHEVVVVPTAEKSVDVGLDRLDMPGGAVWVLVEEGRGTWLRVIIFLVQLGALVSEGPQRREGTISYFMES